MLAVGIPGQQALWLVQGVRCICCIFLFFTSIKESRVAYVGFQEASQPGTDQTCLESAELLYHVPSSHTLVTFGVLFCGMDVSVGSVWGEAGMGAVLIAGGMRQLLHQLIFVLPGFEDKVTCFSSVGRDGCSLVPAALTGRPCAQGSNLLVTSSVLKVISTHVLSHTDCHT